MTGIHALKGARGGGIPASRADQRGSQGTRGASWKGETLALGQNLPIDGSVRMRSELPKEIFGCLFICNTKI